MQTRHDDLFSQLTTHPAWEVTLGYVKKQCAFSLSLHANGTVKPTKRSYAIDVGTTEEVIAQCVATPTKGDLSPEEMALTNYIATGLSSVCQNLSGLQRYTRLIEEQQAIVDHISDGLLVLEPGSVVRHINKTAARLLHLQPDKAIGRPFNSLVDFETVVEPIFTSGIGYVDREMIITSASLNLHIVDTAIPIKDEMGRVVSIVNTFREMNRVRSLVQRITGSHARYRFEDIIGRSAELTSVVNSAKKASKGSANILLSGESGVGKEMFAQSIHNASSRRDGAFIAINCAALPRDLIESELFGYSSGSFTGARKDGRPGKFEVASGGTIFLDEISELPLDVQAMLLRVLQEREVVRIGDATGIPIDVRVISACNRNLRTAVSDGSFRADLYYRCNVIEIELPSLRSRPSDIPALAYHFLAKYASLLDKSVFGISARAMKMLQEHQWPGNVRELENTLERTVNLCDHQEINEESLGLKSIQPIDVETLTGGRCDQNHSLKEVERECIIKALTHTKHNVTRSAELLGISKPALYAKVKRHRIMLERRG